MWQGGHSLMNAFDDNLIYLNFLPHACHETVQLSMHMKWESRPCWMCSCWSALHTGVCMGLPGCFVMLSVHGSILRFTLVSFLRGGAVTLELGVFCFCFFVRKCQTACRDGDAQGCCHLNPPPHTQVSPVYRVYVFAGMRTLGQNQHLHRVKWME